MTERLLNTKQVAERMGGVSESTVRQWRYAGTGPKGFKVGRRVLYPESEIDRWIRELQAAEVSTP